MCAIAGIYNFRSGAPADAAALARMSSVMVHRGPDDAGTWLAGEVGLAHRRLSIIDLEGGRQPMVDARGDVLVFNGEIYNYLELRDELGGASAFRTSSDTEVLLRAWQAHGTGCLERFLGMFAFAIWDGRRLVLARDRLGIKPLYWAPTDDGLVFASELKAIVASGLVPRELDRSSVAAYVAVGYVPGEVTLVRGVRRVAPGTMVVVDAGGVDVRRWWSLRFEPRPIAEDEAAERFRALVDDAIRLHMRSDVPVGVFLSGGLDSSAVVGALAPRLERPIETFSVYYALDGFDETPSARLVAARSGTRHREVEMTPRMFVDFLPRFAWHMDEPVTEAAAVSLYFVSALARRSVTVVLSGEGADEILAGYDVYAYMEWIERFRRLPPWLRRGPAALAARLGGARGRKYAAWSERPLEERYLGVSTLGPDARTPSGRCLWADGVAGRPSPAFTELLDEIWRSTEGQPALNRMLALDTRTWLPDDILLKADRMSMAASVELRVPFLDHRIVEMCAALPPRLKRRGLQGKRLLRRALGDVVPPSILRRKKLGFPTPLASLFWGPLGELAGDVLLDGRTAQRGLVDRRAAAELLDRHARGEDHHARLWQALVLELWGRAILDGEAA